MVEFFPSGESVRRVVTLEPLHDEEFTWMPIMGFTSQLTKLDRRFRAADRIGSASLQSSSPAKAGDPVSTGFSNKHRPVFTGCLFRLWRLRLLRRLLWLLLPDEERWRNLQHRIVEMVHQPQATERD
jgi:hypothetical protein